MDTPSALRGSCFPTHLTSRCPCFHACVLCHGCTQYNPHSLDCNECTARIGPENICNHSDAHQLLVRHMNEKTRLPMFHPDQLSTNVEIPVAEDTEWNKLSREVGHNLFGNIGQITEGK